MPSTETPEPKTQAESSSASRWGSLDDRPTRRPADPLTAPDLDQPPPEAAASLLRDGEVVWARFEQMEARLGSGIQLLVHGPAEGVTGWRRVEVVDAAQLGVRVLPIAWANPQKDVGDDPALLYRPALPGTAPRPARAEAFPVGQGPDLQALLAARIKALEAIAQDRVLAAERQAKAHIAAADERVQIAEHQMRTRTAAAEQQAKQLTAQANAQLRVEIDKVNREAENRVSKIADEMEQLRRSYEGTRMLVGLLLIIGVPLVLFLLIRGGGI